MGEKIGFVGCGAMGGALVRAICGKTDAKNVAITDVNFESAQRLAKEVGCVALQTNVEIVKFAKYIFLTVKPQIVPLVLSEINASLQNDNVLVSMAAGVTLEKLQSLVSVPVIRIMPNTPAQVAEGMIALCHTVNASEQDVKNVEALLASAGKVQRVNENLMDVVTAVSGSGPAYVFVFIEALADAAVRCGMTREQAYLYASQTVKGSAAMVLQSDKVPAQLKDAVCSPSGTTIEGVAALEKNGFRDAVLEAVKAAFEKSKAIGK
ncbi:MAG: pyrroline-5-carboxylate reductase [Treponema sp.]|nr:pyrroline-5-carboxylate reductase [Treponema sp.]